MTEQYLGLFVQHCQCRQRQERDKAVSGNTTPFSHIYSDKSICSGNHQTCCNEKTGGNVEVSLELVLKGSLGMKPVRPF